MRLDEFTIGGRFRSDDCAWRCTDIGTRVVVAIKLDHDDDPSWYSGPPYALAEFTFDEYDLEGCTLAPEAEPEGEPLEGAREQQDEGADTGDEVGWLSTAEKAARIAQAHALREQARVGGLAFDVYLPPNLADWLLGLVEQGVFVDPGEAVFVILDEHRELEPHADLRQELLRRGIQEAIDDPRPGVSAEEFAAEMRDMCAAPHTEPAVWTKPDRPDERTSTGSDRKD